MKASVAVSNEQMQHIIVIMLAENGQFVFTGSNNIMMTIKNTDELVNMKGILLENKKAGVMVSSSQLFDLCLVKL